MKRLSKTEIDEALENSMGQLPQRMSDAELQRIRQDAQAKQQPSTVRYFQAPYTNEELNKLRDAATRKGWTSRATSRRTRGSGKFRSLRSSSFTPKTRSLL